MSMRISSKSTLLLALIAVAGCDRAKPADAAAQAEAESGVAASRIACQPAGAAQVERVCGVEREMSRDGLVLTIRHPDGSFRRLLVTRDGRGVVSADGAEPAIVRVADTIGSGGEIEVLLAGNRYILPARVKGTDAAP